MRADGDYRPSHDAKLDAVRALVGVGFDLRLALDDDPRNAAMFRAAGIPCLEISGASPTLPILLDRARQRRVCRADERS